jgi:phosphoribosyl 1,2-cyclic phosphodiesterase
MEKLRFQSFASGSSGNCYYIGNAKEGILIDAGIGVRTIRKCLRNIDLDFENILGVFVTHDHADHIKSVGVLGEK